VNTLDRQVKNWDKVNHIDYCRVGRHAVRHRCCAFTLLCSWDSGFTSIRNIQNTFTSGYNIHFKSRVSLQHRGSHFRWVCLHYKLFWGTSSLYHFSSQRCQKRRKLWSRHDLRCTLRTQ
jgi:hypothetical protein